MERGYFVRLLTGSDWTKIVKQKVRDQAAEPTCVFQEPAFLSSLMTLMHASLVMM